MSFEKCVKNQMILNQSLDALAYRIEKVLTRVLQKMGSTITITFAGTATADDWTHSLEYNVNIPLVEDKDGFISNLEFIFPDDATYYYTEALRHTIVYVDKEIYEKLLEYDKLDRDSLILLCKLN